MIKLLRHSCIYIVNKKTKLISVALERIHYVKATTIVMYIDVDIR